MTATYRIAADGKSITCLRCAMTSWNFEDVRQLYCGNCHQFHAWSVVLAGIGSYCIARGLFGRWLILNAERPDLAWSGRAWVPHQGGIPRGGWQVCNFDSEDAAEQFAQAALDQDSSAGGT